MNNIYISDNQQDYFQINNIELAEGLQINSLDKTFDNKMVASIKDNGLFIADDIDLNKFNTQYVWLNNQNYLQHNFTADSYNFIEFSLDGKSLMTVSDKDSKSTFKEFNIKTGSLKNSMDLSFQRNTDGCNNFNFLTSSNDLSLSQRYMANSFFQCESENKDSIIIYDIISHNTSKIINTLKGADTNNTIAKLYPAKLLYIATNQIVTSIPIKWSAGNPVTVPLSQYYDTKINLFNSNNGDTIRRLLTTPFKDGHNGTVTSLALSREKLYLAVAKSALITNTNEHFTDIDIIDPSLNFIRRNIILDSNISISNILFSPDNNSIVVSKSSNYYSTPSNNIDKFGTIAKYDILSKQLIAEIKNIHTVSMVYSPDSLSFMFSCYATENNLTVGKIYIADFNTFKLTDSITVNKDHLGNIAVSDKSDYLAMSGFDGVIRLYKNPASVSILKSVFTADKVNINTNDSIQFYNVSTGNPQTYKWEFGDNEISNEFEPTHKYTKSGTYSVTLTISKNSETDLNTKTNYIKVYDKTVLDFTADKIDGFNPMQVTFTNTSTGNYRQLALGIRRWQYFY